MKEQLKQVEEFHNLFNIKNNSSPCLIGEKGYMLRYNLAQEELDEYLQACIKGDKVAILDSLIDQLYVLLGTFLRHGFQNQAIDAFTEVHNSNLSKLDENFKPVTREDGKIIKSKNYRKPELSKFIYD